MIEELEDKYYKRMLGASVIVVCLTLLYDVITLQFSAGISIFVLSLILLCFYFRSHFIEQRLIKLETLMKEEKESKINSVESDKKHEESN